MARSLVKSHGDRVEIASTAAAHTVGDVVLESGFIGVCNSTCLISSPTVLTIAGRVRVKVPASVAQGDYLYAAGAPPTNGILVANLTTTALTKTSASNTLVAQCMETPLNNLADVLLLAQQGGKK